MISDTLATTEVIIQIPYHEPGLRCSCIASTRTLTCSPQSHAIRNIRQLSQAVPAVQMGSLCRSTAHSPATLPSAGSSHRRRAMLQASSHDISYLIATLLISCADACISNGFFSPACSDLHRAATYFTPSSIICPVPAVYQNNLQVCNSIDFKVHRSCCFTIRTLSSSFKSPLRLGLSCSRPASHASISVVPSGAAACTGCSMVGDNITVQDLWSLFCCRSLRHTCAVKSV